MARIMQKDKLAYFGLLIIMAIGISIRLIPVLEVGGIWLADLDPYRNLRAVNKVLEQGKMPLFDPLSVAPNGTSATYATSQGYYMLNAVLILTSGLDSIKMMSISPIICEPALLLTVYAFALALTKSRWAGLATMFFASLGQGWSMIGMIGTCPLAENFGVVIFTLTLLLCWKYNEDKKKSPLLLMISGFLLGTSFLIHPITYFYLVIVLFIYTILLCSIRKRICELIYFSKLIFISSFAIAIQWSLIKDLKYSFYFTHGALWLATLQPVYTVIDFYVVLSEVGVIVSFLSLLEIALVVFDKKWEKNILLSWVLVMLFIIWSSQITSIRLFLANLPFGAFFILSHRVMPYLHVALSLLGGLAVAEYIWPSVKHISGYLSFPSSSASIKIGALLIIVLLLAFIPTIQSSISYAINYSSFAKWAQRHSSLIEWVKENTGPYDVFIVNELCLGEVLRTLAERPTVFTLSYQDIATPDIEKRMLLYSAVYIIGYDERVAQRLLYDFNVSYVIVIRDQFVVDLLNKRYVYVAPEESFPSYLKWLDEKFYLKRIYSDPSGQFYVYSVNRDVLLKDVALPEVKP